MGKPNFKDKKIASKAGSLSKPGKHKKTLEWEAFGSIAIGSLMTDVLEYLKTKPIDERITLLMQLLNYFKPKYSSTEIQAEVNTRLYDAIEKAFDGVEDEDI